MQESNRQSQRAFGARRGMANGARGGRGGRPRGRGRGRGGMAANSHNHFSNMNLDHMAQSAVPFNMNQSANAFSSSSPMELDNATPSAPAAPISADAMLEGSQTTRRFEELRGLIDERLLATITGPKETGNMGFTNMSPVQAATLEALLQRNDVLAQARTGTGKTLAFLLPALQNLIANPSMSKNKISLLVISPTRELALQIAAEAKALAAHLPYKVCTAIGGTNVKTEAAQISRRCDILVGTPGRLLDHLGDPDLLRPRLQELDTFVLDEADRLLDMGFLPSIKQIHASLADKKVSGRQSMLFSATMDDDIHNIARLVLSPGAQTINTVPKGEAGTHKRVPQHLIITDAFSEQVPALVGSIIQEIRSSSEPMKAIIFGTNARGVDHLEHVLETLQSTSMRELPKVSSLHSRMTQSARTRITKDYREAKSAILVATDVVARGMDFPGVTHVFQVGLPDGKESYIHRLGRTGRAGKEGRGFLILAKPETFFVRQLKDVTFVPQEADISSKTAVYQASQTKPAGPAYQAWLGYYKTHMKKFGWSPEQLVAEANKYAFDGLGASEVPALEKKTVGKMQLKNVKGLKIVPNTPSGR